MYYKILTGIIAICLLATTTTNTIQAQHSEIGLWVGSATYFGDLNPDYDFLQTRPAIGALYRYTVSDYVVVKAGLAYGNIKYHDNLSNNPYQSLRNLSFKSSIWELSGQLDLHFKKYIIGNSKYSFTPYLTSGLAIFRFNPKTKFQDEWYTLNEIGTEGQLNEDFTGNKKYPLIQMAIPLGLGVKYWMNNGWNFYVEAAYRKTFTDYIDDVSTVYMDSYLLGDGSITSELYDRSDEITDVPIGIEGKQRGFSNTNDGYMMLNVGITYTLFNRQCPRSF